MGIRQPACRFRLAETAHTHIFGEIDITETLALRKRFVAKALKKDALEMSDRLERRLTSLHPERSSGACPSVPVRRRRKAGRGTTRSRRPSSA